MAPKAPKAYPKPKGKMIGAKVTKTMVKKPAPKKAAPKLIASSGPSNKVSVLTPTPDTNTSDADYASMLTKYLGTGGGLPDWPTSIQNGMTGSTTVIDLDKDNV